MIQQVSYITNFGEHRYLFPVKGGRYALYPYDDSRGNFRINNGRVMLLVDGVWNDVGELSEWSKEQLEWEKL